MLTGQKRQESFDNVRKFLEFLGEIPECPPRKVNVLVQGNKQFSYHNIGMSISQRPKYRDYGVDLMWEDDVDQPDYTALGLRGKYSSNFVLFAFTNGTLSFADGNNQISILPK